VRIFALSLDLPADYFDAITSHPGADGVYNMYPAVAPGHASSFPKDVGLGAHTDLQCFTLLWQDMSGGLQVLNSMGEWVWVRPIDKTLVVNIGDYLMRLTNDRYKSTVHRAYNMDVNNKPRISMPFFFGGLRLNSL
jgi:isopenicillin N synthase-like dioxygenase